jgi:serine protease AprX
LAEIRQSLDWRCRWRRLKVLSEKNIVDEADIPLFSSYTKKVESLARRLRASSRWLNALSVEASPSEIQAISRLEFVSKIDLVASFQRGEPLSPCPEDSAEGKSSNPNINYGRSFLQLDQINVPSLHQLGYSGRGVMVCLLDVGFRKSHEVFNNAHLVSEWDFVNNDNDVQQNLLDPNDYSDSHGTATWSLIGGYKPGELIGPAYGADFLLAKTETDKFEEPIEEDYWVAGIEWAEQLGAEVVSSSLGYTDWYTFQDMDGKTAVTTKAANRAAALGVVVVNAAGNERGNAWGHIIAPADGFDVIAVGAVDSSGNISSFSSPGPTYDGRIKPEVCALGVDNWIATNTSNGASTYGTGRGTSFATPLVAGVAALLLEIHRDWTPAQVRSALLSSASRSSNPDNDYGWGIVNAASAANMDMALLKLQSYDVDDDSSGASRGNGDGQVEAGETIELRVSLENEGLATAYSLEGTLSATNPEVVITHSKVAFPDIPSLASRSALEPFVLRIPAYYLGHYLVFRLQVQGPNSLTLYEAIRIPVSR